MGRRLDRSQRQRLGISVAAKSPPPRIAVASGGPASARMAAELGDGIFVTEPRTDVLDAYAEAGGDGPRYAEVPLS